MPKYFISQLGWAEQEENALAILEYIETLFPLMGNVEKSEKETRAEKIQAILLALTARENLQFRSALENMPFKEFLNNFFLQFDWKPLESQEDDKKGEPQSELEKYFGDKYNALMSNLSKLRKSDQETAAKSERTSVIDILNKKGFLSANEPFFPSDLEIALEGYRGEHKSVTVLPDVSLYIKDSPDKATIEREIKKRKEAAQREDKPHKILVSTNNGTYHYVFLDLTIQPLGAVEVCLKDSKKEDKVSAEHKEKNNTIVASIQEVSGVPFESKIEYTGEDETSETALLQQAGGERKLPAASSPSRVMQNSLEAGVKDGSSQLVREESKSRVVYTGEQGENANCPFYSVREVVRIFSKPPFDGELKVKEEDNLAEAAASGDIVKMQLAMVRKVAAKRKAKDEKAVNFNISALEVDELGILHTVPATADYLMHKKIRLREGIRDDINAFNKEIDKLINADEKEIGKLLVKILNANIKHLFQDKDEVDKKRQKAREEFRFRAQTNCMRAIENAKDSLNNLSSTGWKLLINILVGVFTFGSVHLINRCVTGRWSLFGETPEAVSAASVRKLEKRFNTLIQSLDEKVVANKIKEGQSHNPRLGSPR